MYAKMTEPSPELTATPRVVGRYALFDEIAAGGMATVHLGRLVGQVGFSRTVAVKRLHPQYAKDAEFVTMFVDEARLASRIQHPNVVSTLDVVKTQSELFLVMEYVQGEALSKLVRNAAKRGERIPPHIVLSVMSGMLHGLHAAHEAKSENREPLNIVHRDISPQNVLVGLDGVARVLDFGVAKAAMRSGATRDGQMKGKLSYMSPEQLNGKDVDRRSDVFAAGVVLWEALAGKRLFAGADAGEILGKVLAAEIPSPKSVVPSLPDEVSDVVMRSLDRDPDLRYQTARDFAVALEQSGQVATTHSVGEWVREYGGDELNKRLNLVARVEGFPMEELAEPHSGVEPLSPAMGPDPSTGSHTRLEGAADGSSFDSSRPGTRNRRLVIGAGAGLLLLLGFSLWLSLTKEGSPVEPERTQIGAGERGPNDLGSDLRPDIDPESSNAAPQPSLSAVPVSSSLPSVGSAVAPSAVAPSAVAPTPSTSAPQPRDTKPPTPRAKDPVIKEEPTPRPRPDYRPKPRTNCDPPWYFDAKGIKRTKLDCLK
jgi:serine/threonine-protein kinase